MIRPASFLGEHFVELCLADHSEPFGRNTGAVQRSATKPHLGNVLKLKPNICHGQRKFISENIQSCEFGQKFTRKAATPRLLIMLAKVQVLPNPIMTSRRSQLQEDTYFRVLRMLQENPDMTQREIAEKLGISTSGLNYCLRALIDKGSVKVQNFTQSKNKFGYIYVLTPQGLAEKAMLTGRFLQRKMTEYDQLQAEIEALKTEMACLATDGRKTQNA